MQAIWNGEVIAESDETVVVEGNHYFPASSVHRQYLVASDASTACPWKGTASYYSLHVNGKTNKDAAWYYRDPKPAAKQIAGRVAFWRGVHVTNTAGPGTAPSDSAGLGRSIAFGAIGGLAGGVIFGMMMSMLGVIRTVALLAGSESVAVGWGVHLAISVFIGATFGLLAKAKLTSWGAGIGLGVAYGMFWWVLGGLILMPARLGMPVFVFDTMAWQSLMGHMIFGLVLGAVTVALTRQSRGSPVDPERVV